MEEPGGESALLKHFLRDLKARNARETVPFRRAFESHQRLLYANRLLRVQGIEADKELVIMRHKLSENLSPSLALVENSDAVRRMRDELSQLQGQVTDRYRSQAEHAAEQLRLMKEVQLLRAELRAAKDSLERLQIEHGESMVRSQQLEQRCEELEADAARLSAEASSLRSLLGAAETVRERLTAENHELVDRMVKDKSALSNTVNRMNDEVASLRHQLETARKAAAEAAAITTAATTAGGAGTTAGAAAAGTVPECGRSDGGAAGVGGLVGLTASDAMWSAKGPEGVPSRCVHTLSAHGGGANDVCFGANGAVVATAGDDGTVRVWDASTGQPRAKLQGQGTGQVSMMAVDMHDEMVAAASSDNRCRVWNFVTGRELANLTGHLQKVVAVRFCDGGRRVVTGSHDCAIKVWDVTRQWTPQAAPMRTTSKCNALDARFDGVLVSGHMDGSLRVWDLRESKRVAAVAGLHADQITSVAFLPNPANMLLTQSWDNTIKLLDARMFGVLAVLGHVNFRTAATLTRSCFSPDGQLVASGSADGGVYVWALSSSASALASAAGPAAGAAGAIAAASFGGGGIVGRMAAVLETHAAPVAACHWAPHWGGYLASLDKAGGLALWAA